MDNTDRSFLMVVAGILGILFSFVAGIAALVMEINARHSSAPCVEMRPLNGDCSNSKHRLEVTPGAILCRCPHTLGTPAVSSATP